MVKFYLSNAPSYELRDDFEISLRILTLSFCFGELFFSILSQPTPVG